MLFKYYFRYGSLLLMAIATVLDCQGGLSCVPLVSFMNLFFFFFLIMKNIIDVFLYLYLLVIKPFNLLSKSSLVHALTCFGLCDVFRTYCTQNNVSVIESGIISL